METKMHASDDNPTLTPLLRLLTLIEVIVLAGAGGLLFFAPETAQAQWPWTIAPFNTRFMGAIYLGALTAVLIMLWVARWAPARPVLVTIFIFTTIVLAVSALYAARFDFQRWGTWAWFALYIILPLNAAYHLYRYRSLPPASAAPVPRAWRVVLLIASAALYIYGLGLLAAPAFFSGFWPWAIDDFHARIYSATFIAGASGLLVVSRLAARVEFETAALAQVTFCLFAILGVLVVDASVRRVDWSQAGGWLWIGALALGLIGGLGMLWRSRQMSGATQRA
jgi:hypothetical protein